MDSRAQRRNHASKLGAIQAKPESGARIAWDLRAEPKSIAKPEKKLGRGQGRGSVTLPPLVALLLEQAVDASFYELTLPKHLNYLGVGSVELRVATCHAFCVIVPHSANFPAFRKYFMRDAICPAILLSRKFNIIVI